MNLPNLDPAAVHAKLHRNEPLANDEARALAELLDVVSAVVDTDRSDVTKWLRVQARYRQYFASAQGGSAGTVTL